MGLIASRSSGTYRVVESEGEEETDGFPDNYNGNFGVPTGTITDDILSFAQDGTDPGEELHSALKHSWSGKRCRGLRVTFYQGTPEGSPAPSISEGSFKTLGFLAEGPVLVPEAQRWKWKRRPWESLPEDQRKLISAWVSPRSTCAPHPDQTSNEKVSVKVIWLIGQSEI